MITSRNSLRALAYSAAICAIAADGEAVVGAGATPAPETVPQEIGAFFAKLWVTIKTDVSAAAGWAEQEGENALLGFWNIILKPAFLGSEPKLMQDFLTLVLAYMLNASAEQKAADISAVEADFNTFVASVKPEAVAALQSLGSAFVQGFLSMMIGLLQTGKLVLPAVAAAAV